MRGGWSRTSRPTSSPGTPSLQSAIWEDDVRTLLIVVAIALGGCAAQRLNFSMYTRTDGRPVDAAKQQAALAQCKGEASAHHLIHRASIGGGRKRSSSMPAWRGVVTFRRSSEPRCSPVKLLASKLSCIMTL